MIEQGYRGTWNPFTNENHFALIETCVEDVCLFFFFFFIGVYSLRRMLPFVLSNIKIVGGTNTKTNKQTTNKPTIIELGRDKNN